MRLIAAQLCLGFVGAVLVLSAGADSLKVKTASGKVEGEATADGKVVAFKGIPYAAPPVGDLRWKAPQPAGKWHGVKQAKAFGSHCEQGVTYGDMIFHDPGASEDCLTLNVWTPAAGKRAKLPVMVWIYGGGFRGGGTSAGRQDGQFLAHRGVVVVSMNYRLGIWGFLAHPELTAESPQHASGNYGLMDIAAAIQWTKDNIEAFGGDPGNITIFGESAGSFAVSAEMASPLAGGLISKAIGESGAAFYSSGLSFPQRAEAEKSGGAFMQAAFGATTLAEMRKLTSEQLLAAVTAKTTPPPARFGPDVDGYFLPDSVPHIFQRGEQAHVPLLAGWNADEGGRKSGVTAASFHEQAVKDFGPKADALVAVYGGKTEADAPAASGDYARDKFIAYSTWRGWRRRWGRGKIGLTVIFSTMGRRGISSIR
jgi:para-nitrobenzyl esterase